jgi:hypothetical protein
MFLDEITANHIVFLILIIIIVCIILILNVIVKETHLLKYIFETGSGEIDFSNIIIFLAGAMFVYFILSWLLKPKPLLLKRQKSY